MTVHVSLLPALMLVVIRKVAVVKEFFFDSIEVSMMLLFVVIIQDSNYGNRISIPNGLAQVVVGFMVVEELCLELVRVSVDPVLGPVALVGIPVVVPLELHLGQVILAVQMPAPHVARLVILIVPLDVHVVSATPEMDVIE
jgi:hypothetical protein